MTYFQVQIRNKKYYIVEEKYCCVLSRGLLFLEIIPCEPEIRQIYSTIKDVGFPYGVPFWIFGLLVFPSQPP